MVRRISSDSADHRVKLALAGLLGEVLAILVQCIELDGALLVGHARVATKVLVGLLYRFARDAQRIELLARLAAVFGQRDEQVFARSVAVAHLLGDLHRVVDGLHQTLRGNGHAKPAAGHLGRVLDGGIDVALKLRRVSADALDDGGEVVLSGVEQRLEQMNAFNLRRRGVVRNAHCSLKSLLSRNCQFV